MWSSGVSEDALLVHKEPARDAQPVNVALERFLVHLQGNVADIVLVSEPAHKVHGLSIAITGAFVPR